MSTPPIFSAENTSPPKSSETSESLLEPPVSLSHQDSSASSPSPKVSPFQSPLSTISAVTSHSAPLPLPAFPHFNSSPSSSHSKQIQEPLTPLPKAKFFIDLRSVPPFEQRLKEEERQEVGTPRKEWKQTGLSPKDLSSRFRSTSNPQEKIHEKKLTFTTSTKSPRSSYKSVLQRFSPRHLTFTPLKHPSSHITSPSYSSSSSSSSSSSLPQEKYAPRASMLLGLTQKKHFDEETAAQELVELIKDGEGLDFVLSLLSKYRHLEKEKKIQRRWDRLLTAIFLYPPCIQLIHQHMALEKIHPDELASQLVPTLFLKKIPHMEVVYILSLYSQEDLKGQSPETLFRADYLSTSLYKEYGLTVLSDYLDGLQYEIFRYWKKKTPPSSFCLSLQKIDHFLKQTSSSYVELNEERKNEICRQTLERNIQQSKNFFRFFLTYFYQSPIPENWKDVLVTRREQIYVMLVQKMSAEEAEIQSQVLVGEIFFLRIINPYLIHQGKLPLEIDALVNLTKMIQALSNQIRFGEQRKDEVFEQFNEIYDSFLPTHQEFIYQICNRPSV